MIIQDVADFGRLAIRPRRISGISRRNVQRYTKDEVRLVHLRTFADRLLSFSVVSGG